MHEFLQDALSIIITKFRAHSLFLSKSPLNWSIIAPNVLLEQVIPEPTHIGGKCNFLTLLSVLKYTINK